MPGSVFLSETHLPKQRQWLMVELNGMAWLGLAWFGGLLVPIHGPRYIIALWQKLMLACYYYCSPSTWWFETFEAEPTLFIIITTSSGGPWA